ncbi:hypothetical protein PC111_g946 [Phytophthora cactorum]|nr:hypothetical protein PC111_g946 [Phytophthora cactorum]
MGNQYDEVVNIVPAFGESREFESWDDFDKAFREYKRKNNLKFRIRSSETTERFNSSITQESLSGLTKSCAAHTDLHKNHTHLHPNTGTQSSAYLTTKTLPLDEQDREDVKTLADARVSSTHITNFLNDRIGCKVTPQQTRNLIHSNMGQESGGDRLKDILHALLQIEGSDVLVIQDQMDGTCGIVMQTKVQKMMFERWGETLAMDFTHGTNNLGYHLDAYGSLVATTTTGSGFPVGDFVGLNELTAIISTILEYFKEKNLRWSEVTTVIIDKDFVERRVLERVFPNAKILLCQFHAISYWKKVVKRPVYRLKIAQQEEMLKLMTKLLYSPTQDMYDAGYDALKEYCISNKKQDFFAYFEKNWNGCQNMWSNFSRGKHFTAGNTTTNRIESNWNQLKMLLGHKTRIDKTIAGLLQHQMAITQQIVAAIGQQHSTSRVPKTVPRFLRAVASRLSTNILEKVKNEWERFMTLMEAVSCKRRSKNSMMWKVYWANQTFQCDDVEWTCNCLFYKSNHLLCRHLMFVAHNGHGFQALPAISVDERWNTFEALKMKGALASAANSLQPIVRISKIKLPKIRLIQDNDEEPTTTGPDTRSRSSTFVFGATNVRNRLCFHLQRYSYAKAMLEPLLEHFSNLSSGDFYRELYAWKETVEVGLQRAESISIQTEECVDADGEYEGDSILDPAYAMETAKLMDALESADRGCLTDQSSDDDEVPPTQQAEVHQELPLQGGTLDASTESATQAKLRKTKREEDEIREAPLTASAVTAVAPVRQVDMISVPKPKSRGRSRVMPKQLRQTKLTKESDRLSVHMYPSGLTVRLDQLVMWAQNTPNLKNVHETMDKYPVQLEDAYLRAPDLTRLMQAAIKAARMEQRPPGELDDRVKRQGIALDIVASVDPKLWKFSSKFVHALVGFYAVKAK